MYFKLPINSNQLPFVHQASGPYHSGDFQKRRPCSDRYVAQCCSTLTAAWLGYKPFFKRVLHNGVTGSRLCVLLWSYRKRRAVAAA